MVFYVYASLVTFQQLIAFFSFDYLKMEHAIRVASGPQNSVTSNFIGRKNMSGLKYDYECLISLYIIICTGLHLIIAGCSQSTSQTHPLGAEVSSPNR